MTRKKLHSVAACQHGVITRVQLLSHGYSRESIQHRIREGWLFPIYRGVYAVGRPDLSPHGHWMAAVLSCGKGAILSHQSAGNLWRMISIESKAINISVRCETRRRRSGIVLHRRGPITFEHVTTEWGIPVTTPSATLVDLATVLSDKQLEAAINEADKRDLVNPLQLQNMLGQLRGQPGVSRVREMLRSSTLVLTDSELERRFLRLIKSAQLPVPMTGVNVNGFKVDFFWRDIDLVVETDGLRYHRTPSQQSRDRLRDQVHTSRGLTTLRFTHAQVKNEPDYVSEILLETIQRLRGKGLR